MNISGSVDNSGQIILIIKSEFSDYSGQKVYLNLSGPVESVTVNDRSGFVLDSSTQKQGNNTIISVTVPSDYLEFEIVTDSLTTKSGSLWNFNLDLGSSYNVSAISASLTLPKGALIKSSNGAVGGSADSLSIFWKTNNLDPQHRLGLKTSYELSSQESTDSNLILIAAGLFVIGLGVIIYYVLANNKKKTSQNQSPSSSLSPTALDPLDSNDVFKTLDEVDKQIIREIYGQKGKTTQAYLYLNTHIAKATLSRRIASLFSKGIITKSQKGNRNLITLGEMFKK